MRELTNKEHFQIVEELQKLPEDKWTSRTEEYRNDQRKDLQAWRIFQINGSVPGTFLHHYIASSHKPKRPRGQPSGWQEEYKGRSMAKLVERFLDEDSEDTKRNITNTLRFRNAVDAAADSDHARFLNKGNPYTSRR